MIEVEKIDAIPLKCTICEMRGTNRRNMRRRCANSREVKNQMVEGGHCRFEEDNG